MPSGERQGHGTRRGPTNAAYFALKHLTWDVGSTRKKFLFLTKASPFINKIPQLTMKVRYPLTFFPEIFVCVIVAYSSAQEIITFCAAQCPTKRKDAVFAKELQ